MTKIGLGTAVIGRPQYINIRASDDAGTSFFNLQEFRAKGIAFLEASYNAGIRYYDTAPGYALAEQMIKEWLGNKNDQAIEVATKWGYTYVANFDLAAKVHEVKEHSINKLNDQWEQSKKLLPHLTIYQIHSATLDSGVLDNNDVLQRLSQIKNEFNIKIGMTSSGILQNEAIRKALAIQQNNQPLFDVVQATYNVFEQSIFEVAGDLRKANVQLVIKEALANGRVFSNNSYPHYQKNYQLLAKLAYKYNTGIDAVALRFVIDSLQPNIILSGAANEQSLKQNLEAYKFQLEPEEIEELKSLKIASAPYWDERSRLNFN